MKVRRFPVRSLISLVLLIVCFAFANSVCEYQQVYRSSEHVGVVNAIDDDLTELSAARRYMAGWPQTFYIKIDYDDLPSYSQFNWQNLTINLMFWFLAIAGFVLYESRIHRLWKANSGENKRRLTIVDLFVCTGLIAGLIAYWRALEQRSAAEAALAVDIAEGGGSTVQTLSLPQTRFKFLPNAMRWRLQRVSEVTLNSPSPELLAKAMSLPYLTTLYIGGGDYDLNLLRGLASKPLLSVLRVSGRRLDPQAVATLASIQQLQSLNLMRTNITSKALQPLTAMPRLQALNLVHTDVELADIGTLSSSKTIRSLYLPHPAAGRGDHLKLDGWPELRKLSCNEYDERPNNEPVILELKQLPKLRTLSLDSLQVFDLQLDQLPELSELHPLHSQWQTRVSQEETVPNAVSVRKLSLGSVPSLRALKLFATSMEEMRFSEPMAMQLEITTAPMSEGGIPRPVTESDFSTATKQAWLNSLSEQGGPSALKLSAIPLEGVDLRPLANCDVLRSLDLAHCGVTPEQLRQLKDMKGLEELNVAGCMLDGQTVAWLATNLPGLRRLYCEPVAIGRLKLENNPKLECVLGRADIPLVMIDALHLEGMPNLKDAFDLPKELRYLQVKDTPSLTGLSTRAPWPEKASIAGVRDLIYFAAGGPRLDDSVAAAVLGCVKLERLTFAYSSVSPETLTKIGELKNLTYLALSGSKVDDEVIAKWQPMTSLRTLRLDETAITDRAIDFISRCENLERLSLRNTQVTAQGLSRLSGLTNLARIDCGAADLSEEKLKAISAFQSLNTLDLSGSKVTAEILTVLKDNPPRMLNRLILRDSEVAGLALVQLAQNHSSILFDLTNADIDPNALAALGSAERVIAPVDDQEDTASQLSSYMMDNMFRSQGLSYLADTRLADAKPIKGQVEPRLFSPDALSANSDNVFHSEPALSFAEPPVESYTQSMSIPAMFGYVIGNISKAFTGFADQGNNHVEY